MVGCAGRGEEGVKDNGCYMGGVTSGDDDGILSGVADFLSDDGCDADGVGIRLVSDDSCDLRVLVLDQFQMMVVMLRVLFLQIFVEKVEYCDIYIK